MEVGGHCGPNQIHVEQRGPNNGTRAQNIQKRLPCEKMGVPEARGAVGARCDGSATQPHALPQTNGTGGEGEEGGGWEGLAAVRGGVEVERVQAG